MADEVTVEVAARPRAAQRGVVRATPEALVIGLQSAPEKDKANVELIEYLADRLRVPRSAVMIHYGADFPGFVAAFEPAREIAYLSDVARLEDAWVEAYHAAEAAPLALAALALGAIPVELLHELRSAGRARRVET